jgi:Na+/H+ antiporter NhaD/arsenite permease-like protein
MRWILATLFVLTYVGISARRVRRLPIGRTATAIVGACALVAVGSFSKHHGLTADEALHAIEMNTLVLLLGMMLISAGLGLSGFFDRIAHFLSQRASSGAALLWSVTLGCGLLSAVLVNDAVCLLATPVVMRVAQRTGRSLRPFLFAVAMGSNAGSALTLSGNPQNMLVARLSGLAYRTYLLHAALPCLAALVVTAAVIHVTFRRELSETAHTIDDVETQPESSVWLMRWSLVALAGVVLANLLGASLAWSALIGASVVLVASRERAETLLARVDYNVLLFFAALFVVVAALRKTGLPTEALATLGTTHSPRAEGILIGALSIGSQIVSNVPLILLVEPWIRTFPDAEHAWTMTAIVSTLAGNLTLLGSVANIIVMEQSREPVGFVAYLRLGVPVTVLSTGVAVVLLQWV